MPYSHGLLIVMEKFDNTYLLEFSISQCHFLFLLFVFGRLALACSRFTFGGGGGGSTKFYSGITCAPGLFCYICCCIYCWSCYYSYGDNCGWWPVIFSPASNLLIISSSGSLVYKVSSPKFYRRTWSNGLLNKSSLILWIICFLYSSSWSIVFLVSSSSCYICYCMSVRSGSVWVSMQMYILSSSSSASGSLGLDFRNLFKRSGINYNLVFFGYRILSLTLVSSI